MSDYIVKGAKSLRRGYTTGACAAAAAVAAAEMLLTAEPVEEVALRLPNGEQAVFFPIDAEFSADAASCAVRKDAGDDPDVTDGIQIVACCVRSPGGLSLRGGEGVGVASCEGLAVPKGEAAINPVPRRMILEGVAELCERLGYAGGLDITVSVPGGEAVAVRTFNPRLGITGGISILGTTGRVEPMSEAAIVETVRLDVDRHQRQNADSILIAPGNYGRAFCADQLGIDLEQAVKYANFLGECLDYLAWKRFKRVLIVGHAGKLFKVAGGVMNTHSSVADCRMEIVTAHAALAGANGALAKQLMACPTTEAVVAILDRAGLAEAVFAGLLEKILFHTRQRVKQALEIEVLVFVKDRMLMHSENALPLAATFAGSTR